MNLREEVLNLCEEKFSKKKITRPEYNQKLYDLGEKRKRDL